VRTGNQAALHVQNDVFGELVLALAPVFLDQRFHAEQTRTVLELLVRLARKGIAAAGTPDAGIWEYRTVPRPQTFSSLMGWAGAERMRVVAARHAPGLVPEFAAAAERLRGEISRARRERGPSRARRRRGWMPRCSDGRLRFLPWSDAPARDRSIARELAGGWVQRYRHDGFGRRLARPSTCGTSSPAAAGACARRLVLERAGRALPPRSPGRGLRPAQPAVGPLPQAYSHVGLIHAAFAASPRWSEIL
jgi:YD repeat-containing protein